MDGNFVVYTHHVLYPLLCCWTPRLTLQLSYCEEHYHKHGCKSTPWDVGLGVWGKIQELNTIYSWRPRQNISHSKLSYHIDFSLFYIHRTSRFVLQTKPIEKRATILARDNVSLDATKLIKIMQAPKQRVVPPSWEVRRHTSYYLFLRLSVCLPLPFCLSLCVSLPLPHCIEV